MKYDKFEVKFKKTDLLGFFIPYSFFVILCIFAFIMNYINVGIFFAIYLLILGSMVTVPTFLFNVKVNGNNFKVRTKIGKKYEFNISEIKKIACRRKDRVKHDPIFYLIITTESKELDMPIEMEGIEEMAGYLLERYEVGELNSKAVSKHCREELVRYRDKYYKEKVKLKNKKEKIKDFIINSDNFGELKFKRKIFIDTREIIYECINIKKLFEKCDTEIRIRRFQEKDSMLYKEIFEYIYSNNKEIGEKFKEIYLQNSYTNEEVENGIKSICMTIETCSQLLEDIDNYEGIGIHIIGIEKLRNLIDNSNENDIFAIIATNFYCSECLVDSHATAYINCRTKEICYCIEKMVNVS